MDKINLEIKFKIAVLATAIGFVIGLIFAETPPDKENGIDLGMAVGLALISGIFGFSILPIIIFEFSNAYQKLYMICGPIGVAFVKLCIKLYTADGRITKKEIEQLNSYMKKEFVDLVSLPLMGFISENKKIKENIVSISKPLLDIKLSERIDVLYRLFLLVAEYRIYNDKEEIVLKEIAKALKIGERRFEMVRRTVHKEKGYKTKAQQQKEQQSQSWNFYMLDQLLRLTYNPFTILGIDQNASNEDIKRAYRNLAKQYHPDKSMLESEEMRKKDALKILEINEAYEAIKKIRGIK